MPEFSKYVFLGILELDSLVYSKCKVLYKYSLIKKQKYRDIGDCKPWDVHRFKLFSINSHIITIYAKLWQNIRISIM